MRFIILIVVFALGAASLSAQDPPPRFESMGLGCCTLRVRSIEGSAEGRYQGMPVPSRIVLSPCKGGLCPKAGSPDSTIGVSPGVTVEIKPSNKHVEAAIPVVLGRGFNSLRLHFRTIRCVAAGARIVRFC